MEIKCLVVPPIGTNCYILIDEGTNHAAIVDPGGGAEEVLEAVKGLTVEKIFLTHGHFDHTGAVDALVEALPPLAIYLHKSDMAEQPERFRYYPTHGCNYYQDGDTVQVGDIPVKVLHTPGHTPGGVCLLAGDALFTGDTLFTGSMGRTDLPGGSYEEIMASLKKLGALAGDYQVLPGHEAPSTLNAERQGNYYLREAMAH